MEEGQELPIEEDPRTRPVKPKEFILIKDEQGNPWVRHCSWCTPVTRATRKKFPKAEFAGTLCEKCEKKLDKQFEKLKELEKNG